MKETKDLAVVNSGFIVPQMDAGMGTAMAEEMDGLTINFDKVKIPSGGGIAFEVPGDNPDNPDMTKELIGVIVDHHAINAYWEEKFEGQNNPPDCSSLDGKVGEGCPGGYCDSCRLNKFGSAQDGKGKACKNMRRIYILRSGEIFPLLLTLPPSSIKPFSDFMSKRVVGKGLRSSGILTKITLKKTQNKSGITYSEAQFSVEAILDKETAYAMSAFSQNIKQTTRKVAITEHEDIAIESEDNGNVPF